MKCKTCGEMACMAHGGQAEDDQMKTYAMDPDVPAMKPKTMAEGGEASDDMSGVDDELNDMVAGELMEAFEKKDKQGVLDAIKALVMNCGGGK